VLEISSRVPVFPAKSSSAFEAPILAMAVSRSSTFPEFLVVSGRSGVSVLIMVNLVFLRSISLAFERHFLMGNSFFLWKLNISGHGHPCALIG
jgi:hypothetical protein